VGGIVTDVTERRRLEAEVLRVSDREQLRISQDLHDGVGQQLAGIWCLSEVLRKLLQTQALPEAAQAAKISGLLKGALNQTRSLARGLHPVSTEPNGLMSALRELAASVTDMFKVTCKFECAQPVLVHDATVATNLYRIAQEAVTNAVKHGQPQNVGLSLSLVSQRFTLAVRDDGVGIRRIPRQRKGMGLRIMNYRASMIGGTVTIQKPKDGGTEVVCTVPETGAQEQAPNGQANAKTERAEEDLSGR
jgi:signal transduction histidine kinase